MPHDIPPSHFAFIINPLAGRRHNDTLGRQISQVFQNNQTGHTYEVLATAQPDHAREIATELAARHGGKLIAFACGGDGTAHEVANGITGTQAAMGILPIGTANDFARAALSRIDLAWLLENITRPEIRPIDVIRVDDRISLNITSLGFDTKVQCLATAIKAKARWLGSLSYPLAITYALMGGREYAMHYELATVDSAGAAGRISGDASFILAAICNGRFYGGGFNPAPQARLDDGRLDFCLVDCLPLLRILPLIPLYKKGQHLTNPAVHNWQVTGGRIEAPAGKLLGNYDGENFEKTAIEFAILPGALRFAFY